MRALAEIGIVALVDEATPDGKAGGVSPRADVPRGAFPDPRLLSYAGKQFVELLQLLRQSGRRAL
jgi:hypothetical protein